MTLLEMLDNAEKALDRCDPLVVEEEDGRLGDPLKTAIAWLTAADGDLCHSNSIERTKFRSLIGRVWQIRVIRKAKQVQPSQEPAYA